MVKREKSNYLIQSVSHALDVVEELAKVVGEVGVTELSKRLKLHKNNVFRLLATLELRGYVEQNRDSEDYRLGVKVLQLGQAYLLQSKLNLRALPILKALSEATGETVSLAVLNNGQVQYPISIESKKPVRVASRVASSFPAKQNAAGRLLTAQLPDTVLSEMLSAGTTQDVAIRNQLQDLRASGQLIDRGATEAEVVSICRTIKGHQGEVVGAIEILIPQFRAKVESIVPQVEEAASTLSNSLGNIRGPSLAATVEKEVAVGGTPVAGQAASPSSGLNKPI
ncbi:MAG: IclR family transcriptional regulator [Proteobacteria bacterium]|nr:MAG: IclR family transcriptional regulator [Pseudomonadota bacterium]